MSIVLKVDNSSIMDSIESAHLSVTSPTGRTIRIKKIRMSRATEAQRECFAKFCKDPMIRFIGEMEATREEMQLLLECSKLK